jgi:surface protein
MLNFATFKEKYIFTLNYTSYPFLFLMLLLGISLSGCKDKNPGDGSTSPIRKKEFITKWKTDNSGYTKDRQVLITVNLADFNGLYNYNVDWGDGNQDTNIEGDITHLYDVVGTYEVTITGDFPQLYFDEEYSDRNKLVSVESWGGNKWLSMKKFFYQCRNISLNATDTPDLSLVTDMSYMFAKAAFFDQPIGDWDVSNVEVMTGVFYDAYSFNQDINDWDVSKVENMDFMFSDAHLFNQSLNNWNLVSLKTMHHMFSRANTYNQSMDNWDVSSVKNMSYLFSYAQSFNQSISNWDVSSVETMFRMFSSATSFNQDISAWNVSNVHTMLNMFSRATSFDQDLGRWPLISVRNMRHMFSSTNLSVGNYDSILIGWSQQQDLGQNVPFDAGSNQYSAASASARAALINVHGWNITDGGITH